jgi:hypothetical protein
MTNINMTNIDMTNIDMTNIDMTNMIGVNNKNDYVNLLEIIKKGGGDIDIECTICPTIQILARNWLDLVHLLNDYENCAIRQTGCGDSCKQILKFLPLYNHKESDKPIKYMMSEPTDDDIINSGYDEKSQFIQNHRERYIDEYRQMVMVLKQLTKKPESTNPNSPNLKPFLKNKNIIFSIENKSLDHIFLIEYHKNKCDEYNWFMYQSWINIKNLEIKNMSMCLTIDERKIIRDMAKTHIEKYKELKNNPYTHSDNQALINILTKYIRDESQTDLTYIEVLFDWLTVTQTPIYYETIWKNKNILEVITRILFSIDDNDKFY